jgi:hypothetical protein
LRRPIINLIFKIYHDQNNSSSIINLNLTSIQLSSNTQEYINFYQQTSTKRRRRKIGDDTGKKRKTDIKFSKNLYTKKGKSRIKTITETKRKIKNSGRQAKIRIRKNI